MNPKPLKLLLQTTFKTLSSQTHGRIWKSAIIGGMLFLNGCTGTHLYKQVDYDLASKTDTAFSEAKLSESLTDERKLLDAVANEEQIIAGRQTLALRDASIFFNVSQCSFVSRSICRLLTPSTNTRLRISLQSSILRYMLHG